MARHTVQNSKPSKKVFPVYSVSSEYVLVRTEAGYASPWVLSNDKAKASVVLDLRKNDEEGILQGVTIAKRLMNAEWTRGNAIEDPVEVRMDAPFYVHKLLTPSTNQSSASPLRPSGEMDHSVDSR